MKMKYNICIILVLLFTSVVPARSRTALRADNKYFSVEVYYGDSNIYRKILNNLNANRFVPKENKIQYYCNFNNTKKI
jgi:hypothetical protein